MQNNFSVGGGRKDRTFTFKLASLLTREGQVAIVANSDLAVLASNQKRLGLTNRNFAGSRVANVSNGAGARQAIKCGLIKRFGHMTHGALQAQLRSVRRCNTAGFLAAML